MTALIIAEHNNLSLLPATLATIDAAHYLTEHIYLLIIGTDCKHIATQAALHPYVAEIFTIEHPNHQYLISENISNIVIDLIQHKKYLNNIKYIMMSATNLGKSTIPRIAAKLNIEQGSEIIKIISANTFQRSIYGGNLLQNIQISSEIKCLTIHPAYFKQTFIKGKSTAKVKSLEPTKFIFEQKLKVNYQQIDQKINSNLELTTAPIVVAGGLGLKSKQNFELIEKLAIALVASPGASKSAVDAGFAPYSWQIGQTGKIIAPKLYVAVGISGAPQHIAGIKNSKIILAINNDINAPILKIAHYAIIDDLFIVIPKIIKELDNYKEHLKEFPTYTSDSVVCVSST